MIKKYNVSVVRTEVWTKTIEAATENIARVYGLQHAAKAFPDLDSGFHVVVKEAE